jgi:hypothetical protein
MVFMRPKLIQSFLLVFSFWFIVTTLYWSLQQPSEILATWQSLKTTFPFIPGEVPKTASIWSSWQVQRDIIMYWSVPVFIASGISALVGALLVWALAFRKVKERTARETGSGGFRGVSLSVGELPVPPQWPRDDIELGADDSEALARMTERERRLLADILGTLSAHPQAYAGEGVRSSLLEHALNLAAKSLENPRYPGLSAIVACAHELGKLTAYTQDASGNWANVKNQDKEAAKILSTLDSWNSLPYQDKNAVMMAVKHHANPRLIPDVDGDPQIHRVARELLSVADVAVTEAVTEEKRKTLENTDQLPDVLFDAFIKALPLLSFQNRGLPKGVAAVAWKIGSRVYMLEIKLRETVMAKLPQDVRGALSSSSKEKQKLQPFTVELLQALDARGWLVKQLDGPKLEAKEALWNIKAGKLDFKGVIIIDVPAEYLKQLPSDDSMYEVSVIGTLFSPGGAPGANGGMSKNDLLGSVLRPAAAKEE